MPTIVAYPSVIETFQRALHEVLEQYLSTGNSQVLMGQLVQFYNCDLYYAVDRIPVEPTGKPFVCFAGTRAGQPVTEKCLDVLKQERSFGYEDRQRLERTVWVGIGKDKTIPLPPYLDPPVERQSNFLDVERVWSQLAMVLAHQYQSFNDRGIYQPQLPSVGQQVPHKDYYLLRGECKLEIRYYFCRGN